MKGDNSEATKRLKGMVGELDLTYQLEASRVLTNLLKVQRAQKRIQRKADNAVEAVRKIDVMTAEHLSEGDSQCSFCKKWQTDVNMLFGGPEGVFICNECVELCSKLLQEDHADLE